MMTPTTTRAVIGRRLAAVSGLFMLLVASLMGINGYLLRTVDPLESPALQTLTLQLASDPANETLSRQVRELDLLARRAFFIRQWQIETGYILLAIATVIFMLALQLMSAGQRPPPDVRQCPGLDNAWAAATRSRQAIAIGGGLLLLLLAGAGILTATRSRVPAFRDTPAEARTITSAPPPAIPQETVVAPRPAEPHPAPPGWTDAARRYWPSFRGAGGLATAATQSEPPIAWDGATGQGILWKREIPRPGFSSPVVWGDRLYMTGADADKREVYAFDTATGALLWTADTEGLPEAPAGLPAVTDDTGYAAPSVATDGQRVIAIFGTGTILALDTGGRRLWSRHLSVPDNHYGHSSSPLIYQDLVYIQYDHFGGSEVMALDTETGQTRWIQPRAAEISWASPILAETGGRMVLMLNAAPMVAAYDALTGEELWSNDCMSGEIGASPAYANGRVFAANQYAQAVALDAADGTTLWASSRLELPDAGSPVATDRYLFLPTSYGVFTCVDATDGSVIWEHEFERGGYGSPVLAGERLYWVTEDGVTRIFKAGDTFELIAEPALGESSVSTPAVVGARLYIRGLQHLIAIGGD